MTDLSQLDLAWGGDPKRELRGAGMMVGDQRPQIRVEVRLGNFVRGYQPWVGDDVRASIYGESRERPWQATWTPRSDWTYLPNIESCDLEQDFDANGVAVATITCDNVDMEEQVGAAGLYHLIQRGYLSPFRGSPKDLSDYSRHPGFPQLRSRATGLPKYDAGPNEWYGYLTKNAQIRVWQGYRDDPGDGHAGLFPTFVGLVDDVDVTALPDRLTVVARDFGQALLDQRVFGWVKSKQLPEPTVFRTTGKSKTDKGVGYGASAVTSRDGHPPRFVSDPSTSSAWISHDHTTADNTEWVEVKLPKGRYDSFALHNLYPFMEVYVGVYAKRIDGPTPATLDGAPINDGWVTVGEGLVPGDNGGWPYLRKWNTMSARPGAHKLNHSIEVGDGSLLRIGFRKLHHIGYGIHRAGVVRLAGIKRKPVFTGTLTSRKRIDVEDVADVVKVVLRWAGFKDWRITQTGADLTGGKGTISMNRANTLMEIIQRCCDATGYVFYIRPPEPDQPDTWETSLGMPVFEPNYALKNMPVYNPDSEPTGMKIVTDDYLLTGIDVKATDEPLSHIIRIRGKAPKTGGRTLGSDKTKRVMAVYRPPWARSKRLAGLIKHFVADPNSHAFLKKLTTNGECLIYAQLVALQMALQAYTGEVEVPGHPAFALNEHVAVFDRGAGVATRVYIARKTSSYQAGENPSWKASLGGALIDVTDVRAVIEDLQATLRKQGKPTDRVHIADALYIEVD